MWGGGIPSPPGVGSGEGALKFLDFFYIKTVTFVHSGWHYLPYLKLFYMQNGTFGLPNLKVTAAFALAKIERDRERKGKTEIKVLVKYVDLLYGEVETPQKALRPWDIWG